MAEGGAPPSFVDSGVTGWRYPPCVNTQEKMNTWLSIVSQGEKYFNYFMREIFIPSYIMDETLKAPFEDMDSFVEAMKQFCTQVVCRNSAMAPAVFELMCSTAAFITSGMSEYIAGLPG